MRVSTRRVFRVLLTPGSLAAAICLAALSGCATMNGVAAEGKSVTAIYAEGIKQAGLEDNRPMRVSGTETMGDMSPYFPIVLPPEIVRGWVPDHVNEAGKLVAGHWIYVVVRESRFALEDKSMVMQRGIGTVVPHGTVSPKTSAPESSGTSSAQGSQPDFKPGKTTIKPPAGVVLP